jgi:cytochrome c peroxidase
LLLVGMAVASAAKRPDAPAANLDFSPQEIRQILSHGPWPPDPAKNATRDHGNRLSGNKAAIALGQQLFFDKRLSSDGQMSCATCHVPAKAFGDGLPKGLGRQPFDRNTPSLWNTVHARWQGWDGAADSLWSQAIRPLTDPREMNADAQHIARVIAADATLSCQWQKLFSTSPLADVDTTLVNAAKAIGAFNASLVSQPTAFDRFRNDLAQGARKPPKRYPLAAQRGLRLFVGRAQCAVCHVGPLFSNGEFGDIGLPFFIRPGAVDSGRYGGIIALRESAFNLQSTWRDSAGARAGGAGEDPTLKTRHVDLQHRNFGEFKVPSLRNAAQTAPYMHDGQLATLQDVVRHYSELNTERLHADGDQILKPLRLSDAESADLVAFLLTLSDPNAQNWKPKQVSACGK